MRANALAFGLLFGLATLVAAPVADACGGCFAPPGSAQVVTDHRMVLSLASTRTTLWDQFQYSGRPEEFSWILPIRYTDRTQVQLASDDFMTLMTNLTVPALNAPTPPPYPPGCAPPEYADSFRGGGGFADAATQASDVAASAPSVQVLREEVVGPYAVSILRGTDAMVLRRWLSENSYVVPAGLEPTLQYYVDLSMDFIALRLRPGEGLNRMVPVRVTVDGYQPRLPLRMIAAGIADKVGLSLVVFNESRVEAMNFPNAQLRDEDFVYDWSAPPTDFARVILDRFDALNRANGGRAWVTESALTVSRDVVVSQARFFPQRTGFADAGAMASASAADDAAFAFGGIGERAVVTRLRADLQGRMLDRDLDLGASSSGERNRFYRFGTERNRPMYSRCPWPASSGAGTGAVALCTVRAPGAYGGGASSALALGLAGIAVALRRRRR